AVGPDADDVIAAEAPLVDPRRGDPDVAVVVADREVAAGGGRHPVAVDSLHRPHDRVARVDQVAWTVHRFAPRDLPQLHGAQLTGSTGRLGSSGEGSGEGVYQGILIG